MRTKLFLLILCNFYFLLARSAQSHRLDSIRIHIEVKDREESYNAVGIPLFSPVDNRFINVTDSLGYCVLIMDTTTMRIKIKSAFYRDTLFTVSSKASKEFIIKPKQNLLFETIVSYYRINTLLRKATKKFQKQYFDSPVFSVAKGITTIQSKRKYLEYYESDGISLCSGNNIWKPWDFAPFDAVSSNSYFYFVPLHQRRSFHWDYNGDTIPPQGERYNSRPFLFRSFYRALEVSGPQFYKNHQFYDFNFDQSPEAKEFYVINFKTKDKYRQSNSDMFLWGEGKMWITTDNLQITKVEFNFTHYNKINLQKHRKERATDVFGTLIVKYKESNKTFFPDSIFCATHWTKPELFIPRAFSARQELLLTESFKITHQRLLSREEKKNIKKIQTLFTYTENDSYPIYDEFYWQQADSITPSIISDLSSTIGLKIQFRKNSEKKYYLWTGAPDEISWLFKNFPKTTSVNEAHSKWKTNQIGNKDKFLFPLWTELNKMNP